MKRYWQEHSTAGSIEEMMLDDDASKIERQDREEILSLLPALEGTRMLELAAGIGRFTSELASKVGELTAVEFIQNFSDKNAKTNGHLGNVRFLCADVTTLEQPAGSYDIIFINWLLMYLGDQEVEAFAKNALRWLAPGGHLFFRESCLQQSGSKARAFNPTHYRAPEQYTRIFEEAEEGPGAQSCFRLQRLQRSQTYAEHKGNPNQLTWLWKKVPLVN